MADRSISVILRAQTDGFVQEIGKAGKSLDELVKKEDKHGKASESAGGKIAQSARLQSDMWTTVGASLAGAGAGITAVNVAVAKTGIEYNTLQQTSRAALRTILGGAQQANEQMDRLDAFARTSPFSKSVFIQAQQQMLGFGIEARKVVPYLSAINEAVAATGGSNQDIAELTRIFSQVQAATKITATDLMQFGQRGIDAASLIGSQMGKTGAQIREEITAGTLDAGVALDALAAGMQQRFEGASAGVKNTMTGAIDRVKAAWRDLSASLMEPAVGREGGGFLVGLTNSLADLIRMAERAPQPIKDFAFALSLISGAGLLAGGGLMAILPRAVETIKAFGEMRQFASDLGVTLKGVDWKATASDIGKISAVAGVATAIIAALSAAFAVQNAELDRLAPSAERVKGALLGLASGGSGAALNETFRTSAGYAKDLGEALDFMERSYGSNVSSLTEFGNGMMDFWGAVIPGARTGSEVVTESLSRIDAELASMSTDQAVSAWKQLDEQWGLSKYSAEALVASFPAYADAIQEWANETGRGALTTQELADAMGGKLPGAITAAGEAAANATIDIKELAKMMKELRDEAISGARSQIAVEESIAAAAEYRKESYANLKAGLDDTTAAGRNNVEVLLKLAESSKNVTGTTEEMAGKQARAHAEFIRTAGAMGVTGQAAEDLWTAYTLIPGEVQTDVSAPGAVEASRQAKEFNDKLRQLPPETQAEILSVLDARGFNAARARLNENWNKTATISAILQSPDVGRFMANIQARISANPLYVPVRAPMTVARAYGGPLPGYASNDRADNTIYAGTPGEWVIQRPTARKYGDHIMARFNRGEYRVQDLQRLAYGGEVGSWQRHQSSMRASYDSVARAQSALASGGARLAQSPGTVRLDASSVQAVAAAIVAGADRISSAAVSSNARALAAAGRPL